MFVRFAFNALVVRALYLASCWQVYICYWIVVYLYRLLVYCPLLLCIFVLSLYFSFDSSTAVFLSNYLVKITVNNRGRQYQDTHFCGIVVYVASLLRSTNVTLRRRRRTTVGECVVVCVLSVCWSDNVVISSRFFLLPHHVCLLVVVFFRGRLCCPRCCRCGCSSSH